MRVLISGDHFIKNELVEERLVSALGKLGGLEFIHHGNDWPHVPFEFNDEIQEYVGDSAEISRLAEDADIIVAHMAPIDRRVIETARRLKAIAVARGGPVNVNVKAATERSVPVLFVPGRNARAVAEYTVALLLAQAKRIVEAHVDLARNVWRTELYTFDGAGWELDGRTVGLIGFGHIGRLVADMLAPFGVKIFVYDPYVRVTDPRVTQVSLEELLQTADFVSLHARVTPETTHLINARTLAMMKPSAHLINTARGPLVDYDALVEALQKGVIAGAALDTFHLEPLPADHPLTRLPNVTLTPHVAGSSKQVVWRAIDRLAEDLRRLFTGLRPWHCINPEVLEADQRQRARHADV